jgi:hypothetical protein
MRSEFTTIEVPTSVASGAPISVPDFTDHAIAVVGAFTGTIHAEATIDGTNYARISDNATGPGFLVIHNHHLNSSFRAIRITASAWTSGTPSAMYSGRNARMA